MGFFQNLRPKPSQAPIINEAAKERNRALDEIFDWQNPKQPNEDPNVRKPQNKK